MNTWKLQTKKMAETYHSVTTMWRTWSWSRPYSLSEAERHVDSTLREFYPTAAYLGKTMLDGTRYILKDGKWVSFDEAFNTIKL